MKSILLIGLGLFGKSVARQLNQLGHQVMAVDKNEERVNECLPFVTNAQIGDGTNKFFLQTLSVKSYDLCIVAIESDFQDSLETTSLLKELGAVKVISRAERDVHEKFLLRNGADEVICPEKQMAKWVAIRYTADHIHDYISVDDKHGIFEVSVPKSWVGQSVGKTDVRKKHNVNILGIKTEGIIDLYVTPDTVLTDKMTLMVFGDYKSLQKCFRI